MNYQLELTPITEIWTGNQQRQNSRLLFSGLKGSLRWWYEMLIRGLDCYACDPTEDGRRCERKDFSKEKEREIDAGGSPDKKADITKGLVKGMICPACYLFGCNGWKSRLQFQQLLDSHGQPNTHLEKEKKFVIPLRERWQYGLEEEERYLLAILCEFISCHGSICGRGGRKPSEDHQNHDEKNKKSHSTSHVNYGLCGLAISPGLSEPVDMAKVHRFLAGFSKNKNDQEWPDFRYLWYADACVERLTMNKMVNRGDYAPQSKKYQTSRPDWHPGQEWLGGDIGISKKIFSFHTVDCSLLSPRIWGYCKADPAGPVADPSVKTGLLAKLAAHNIAPAWGEDYLKKKGLIC
jgi:CRISPR-associated protein Cmr1